MIGVVVKLILLTIVCVGTLFASSFRFVDSQITPKWFVMIGGVLLLGSYYIVQLLLKFEEKKRNNEAIKNIAFGILVFATLTQALYGIFQYFNVLPSTANFRVTGSFDNPAGFAASLCAGFPFSFYFVFTKERWGKYFAATIIFIIALAVVLSGSRTGVISLLIVLFAALIYKFPIHIKSKFLVLLILFFSITSCLYFLKKDSANGRLLIWLCTSEMIKEKTTIIPDPGRFKANYMDYQAIYFEKYPASIFASLADNVNRPFNEYLRLLSDYGLAGFIIFFAAIWFIWKSFKRCNNDLLARISIWCLLSIAVFSFFSYPLTYPFVWVTGILSVLVIVRQANYTVKVSAIMYKRLNILLIPLVISMYILTYQWITSEMYWCKVARKSLVGETVEMLPLYKQLHQVLSNNELFLYNYAAELNAVEHYNESLSVARECERLWADYDLQMLIADNLQKSKQYTEAVQHYKKAAAMCPVKFMPLYKLLKLYETTGENAQAIQIAKVIEDKPIKVVSPTVRRIKQEAKQISNRSL